MSTYEANLKYYTLLLGMISCFQIWQLGKLKGSSFVQKIQTESVYNTWISRTKINSGQWEGSPSLGLVPYNNSRLILL